MTINGIYVDPRQVFDGVMLGAGGITRFSQQNFFTLQYEPHYRYEIQVGSVHTDLLIVMKSVLQEMGIPVSDKYPRQTVKGGKTLCLLMSGESPALLAEYTRWYPYGRRQVPLDLEMSPVVLAFWYMMAGSQSWFRILSFSVGKYSPEEAELLVEKLRDVSISSYIKSAMAPALLFGGVLTVRRSINIKELDSFIKFLSTAKPYFIKSFRYKIA